MDYYGAADKKLAVLAPATIWETKAWESDGFAEVARYLLQKGFAVTLIGLARERGVCAQVTELAPGAVNLAGETTLGELAALVRRSAISVTNDSGPMHLAAALGRPVVSLFGPTDPIWIGPYRRADAVIRANLPCSPCYLRQLSSCRHNHDCMREVSGRTVIERVDGVLRKQPGGAGLAKAEASGR
jgi:ADP-heptose:LPS heptosyltransferase